MYQIFKISHLKSIDFALCQRVHEKYTFHGQKENFTSSIFLFGIYKCLVKIGLKYLQN